MIIFTDLDGTLLDLESYSHRAALPALERIRSLQIPLIICTSKTRREVESIQEELGVREPFIVENGAGIYFPEGYRGFRIPKSASARGLRCVRLGIPYAGIRAFVEQAQKYYPLKGFGDMTVLEVAAMTGLSPEQADRAKDREFTEPFVLEDETLLRRLVRDAREKGIAVTRGGRFYCFTGKNHSKGKAVKRLMDIFEKNLSYRYMSVGLGDGLNDLPMLSQVDIPILIPHPDGSTEDIALPNLMRASLPGSEGWNRAVSAVLSSLEGVETLH